MMKREKVIKEIDNMWKLTLDKFQIHNPKSISDITNNYKELKQYLEENLK